MSIASEITRLQNDSAAIAAAIRAKGIPVPAGRGYDDYADLIEQIGGSFPFKLLTYIETDGTAYINTGIKANAPLSAELKAMLLRPSGITGNLNFFGARTSDTSNRIIPLVVNSSNYAGAYYAGSLITTKSIRSSITNQTPVEVRFSAKGGAQSVGVKEATDSSFTTSSLTLSTVITTDITMTIFCGNFNNSPGAPRAGERLYYARIYGDENYTTPVFLGYPCYYNGAYGLWDFVTNTFFGNAAANGAFSGN